MPPEVAPDLPPLMLEAQARRNLLLAVKETLNNGVRHAGAQTIFFEIRLDDFGLVVEISDDGRGFNVDKGRPGGKGLSNIKGRMELVNGRAEITSGAGRGTRVILSVPLLKSGVRQ